MGSDPLGFAGSRPITPSLVYAPTVFSCFPDVRLDSIGRSFRENLTGFLVFVSLKSVEARS